MRLDQIPEIFNNKQIDGDHNTVTNISGSSLVDGSVATAKLTDALTADEILYFRPGGTGTDGTVDDGTAFPAPAAALSRAYELMDMGHTVRLVQGTDGLTPPFTYTGTGSTQLLAFTKGLPNNGELIVEGDVANKANVILDQTGTANCVYLNGVIASNLILRGFTLKAAGSGTLVHEGSGRLTLDEIDFLTGSGILCSLRAYGSYINVPTGGAISFSGNGTSALQVDSGYFIDSGQITIVGNRTYSSCVVDVRFNPSLLYSANAWATTGTVTGIRADVREGCVVMVGSADVETHFPGNATIRVRPGAIVSDGAKFISPVVAGTKAFVASTTAAVTLPWTQQDAAYNVSIDSGADNYFWVTSKTTTGFTINAKTSTSETVGWTVVRR